MVTLANIQTAETAESAAINDGLAEIAQLKTDLAQAQAGGADQATIQSIVDKIHDNTARLTAALPPSTSLGSTISGGGDTTTGTTTGANL